MFCNWQVLRKRSSTYYIQIFIKLNEYYSFIFLWNNLTCLHVKSQILVTLKHWKEGISAIYFNRSLNDKWRLNDRLKAQL